MASAASSEETDRELKMKRGKTGAPFPSPGPVGVHQTFEPIGLSEGPVTRHKAARRRAAAALNPLTAL